MVTRPILRYHGGKWRIGKWIIAQMPSHHIYVEPFGGAASILLQKDRLAAEIYNDLDGTVSEVFRVLQDPVLAANLKRRLYFTLFSRSEFERCYEPATDLVDAVAKTIVLSFFGFGSDSITRSCRTGFRAKMSDARALPSQHWRAWFADIDSFIDRLRGVVIEQADALKLFSRYDTPGTLFYCDPPYVLSTRSSLAGRAKKMHGYRYEMTDIQHEALAEQLHGLRGMVMLSGYRSCLYETLYADWLCVTTSTLADGARKRTECLWFNPAAAARRPQPFLYPTPADRSEAA